MVEGVLEEEMAVGTAVERVAGTAAATAEEERVRAGCMPATACLRNWHRPSSTAGTGHCFRGAASSSSRNRHRARRRPDERSRA